MTKAPFFADLAEGPEGGTALWTRAQDGVNLRIGFWNAGTKGTVFLFPGRSEYVEKYGRLARDLAAEGWATLAIDWRGQGLSDRLLDDVNIGHVRRFTDYQHDVQAAIDVATAQGLPRPWHMLAHSMGGCIGLRTLGERRDFETAVFSAPMWGILIAPTLQAVSRVVPRAASLLGQGGRYAPTTDGGSYLLKNPFDDNILTTDRDHWNYMVRQVKEQPGFRLGGPSLTWLAEALAETRRLRNAPHPPVPVQIGIAALEKIVDNRATEAMVENWGSATLTRYDGAEHELLMERPLVRDRFVAQITGQFAKV
ncbi:MAG: alpha/beta hydrolase [Pseudomonadota bacterium]